jgi:hypothetical protein
VVAPRVRPQSAALEPLLQTIDHDGIELAFIEKASTVHYFVNGKWIQIPGAD